MSDLNSERESKLILSNAQITLLKLSDLDIQNQRIISQDEVDKQDLEWLTDETLKNF